MNENIWARFDGMATAEEVSEAVESIFEKPKAGTYDVALMSITPKESKNGNPIVVFSFKDVVTDKLMSYTMFLTNNNYPENTPKEIAKVIKMINDITKLGITFTSMSKLVDDIVDISVSEIDTFQIEITYQKEKYMHVAYIGASDIPII